MVAQDEINQAVDLVFSNGEDKVFIKDTINSVASVSVEINGQQYLMSVPITIDIDSRLPLSSSLASVSSATIVGPWAIEIEGASEFTEKVEMSVPGLFGNTQKEYEPAIGNKIVLVEFYVTNVGKINRNLYGSDAEGIDATGRFFQETDLHCPDLNPGENGKCLMVFEVEQKVDIVGLALELIERKELAIP
ncbi:MAG: hypothetical protein ETSY1_25525 [Candidatus Entotheonella factor]|uniref:DUF4352 domain-containing protein n=1 Tax=Entotheonella factor TaxID=1429438 RepID=W4LFB7_ENTF1|nr:MAG: hypothetical protein ETSY1_25525 [Candidatus Entotheonella factor]